MHDLPIYNSVQSYLTLFASEYGYPKEQLSRDWHNWITTREDSERSAKDFVWSMFNTFIMRVSQRATSEEELYKYQTKINWDMLSFLNSEGRNTTATRRTINKLSLLTAGLEDYLVDAVILADNCCVECSKIEGKIYLLKDAEKLEPIPNGQCTRPGGCNCMYIFREKRDKNGRIILK